MKRKYIKNKLLWLLPVLIFLVVQTAEAVPFLLSTNKTATIGGLTFNDDDLVLYNPSTEDATLFFDGSAFFEHNEDIDSVSFLDADSIVISTKSSAKIGSLKFKDEDLVRIDLTSPTTGTASLFFDGSEHFDKNEDVDAVTVLSDGSLLLSTKNKATVGNVTFHKEDLVKYNPVTKIATLFFDGSEYFQSGYGWHHGGYNNIDAVSVIDSDFIVISTAKKAKIGGFIFEDEDLILIDLSNLSGTIATMYFDGSKHFDNAHRADIDAVALAQVGGEPIPEPTTIALLGIGLAGLGGRYWRRRIKKK